MHENIEPLYDEPKQPKLFFNEKYPFVGETIGMRIARLQSEIDKLKK